LGAFEPFGGKSVAEDKILKQIVGEGNKETLKIENVSQQFDHASCGAMTAEDGKEFLRRDEDDDDLSQKIYTPRAQELRQNHIQEINLDTFLEAQFLDEE